MSLVPSYVKHGLLADAHPTAILYSWDRAVAAFRAATENPSRDNLHTESERARILAKYFSLCSPIETAYGGNR